MMFFQMFSAAKVVFFFDRYWDFCRFNDFNFHF